MEGEIFMDFSTGSMIAFAGKGVISDVIDVVTGQKPGDGISHVAILATYQGKTRLFESTSLNKIPCEIQRRSVEGVQAHTLDDTLKYDGCVYVYPQTS
jgi:hypothetical protein